ncbi:MAG: RNA 2',3'-cyclic phosphodiesterase [Anaerolineae bacterium]|nr:RNA 2',3'-cyclic phosphodiesterase [Anaerolineae bacterium]
MRLFIAITLPEPVAAALHNYTQGLAQQVPSRTVKWVEAQNLHLTLVFLGETDASKIRLVQAVMNVAAASFPPFSLQTTTLGCFPGQARPRTIWAGLAGELKAAQSLKQTLDAGLEPLGWPPEKRPFAPHLTLGRVKDERGRVPLPWGEPIPTSPIPVTAIHLIESQLRPAGPLYTIRHSSRLGTSV